MPCKGTEVQNEWKYNLQELVASGFGVNEKQALGLLVLSPDSVVHNTLCSHCFCGSVGVKAPS